LPLVKWQGGKSYLTANICRRFLPHRVYAEPYAGGANVLLNKPRSPVEVLSDLHAGLVKLYRVVRDRPAEFMARVCALPFRGVEIRRELFHLATTATLGDSLEAALWTLLRHRWSRGGDGHSFGESSRLRKMPEYESSWLRMVENLPRYVERLQGVKVENRPALEVIQEHDGPDALHYVDPPYLHSTRTVRDAYTHEMNEAEHVALLKVLGRCRGQVVLSGYPSPLYDASLGRWERIIIDMPNHAGQGRVKARRQEVLWVKPARRLLVRAVPGPVPTIYTARPALAALSTW
jgi:DNA adenine methylase